MSYHTYSGSGGGGGGASQAEVDALVALSGRPALSTNLGTFTGTTIPDSSTIKAALQDLESAVEAVPDALVYRGTWAASTNTPTLSDGSGTTGDYYFVSDAGTVDFGSGNISFAAGDRVVYEGSVWQKWETSVGVKSVNGDTGPDVVLEMGDLDDVDVSGIQDGDTLVWDAGNSEFIPGVAGAVDSVNGQTGVVSLALDDLSDVDAATPNDGDALVWDSLNTEWVPGPAGSVDSVNGQTGTVVLDAGDIANTPAGTISATDVQGAIDELDGDVQAVDTLIDNHIADASGAHAATAISNTPAGTIAATDVQGAINELDGDVQAVDTLIDNHIADTTDAHAASAIGFTPAGGISATDVQNAIEELDTEKAPLASPVFTGNPTAPTPSAGDDDTSIATTEFVNDAIAEKRVVSTFTGTSVSPTARAMDQTFVYTGGSVQTFTGFGSLSGLTNGYRATIMGTSDTNYLSISESDTSDGWIMNGPVDLQLGMNITFEYNSTLGRMVETPWR